MRLLHPLGAFVNRGRLAAMPQKVLARLQSQRIYELMREEVRKAPVSARGERFLPRDSLAQFGSR
jgi:hypothetical protein